MTRVTTALHCPSWCQEHQRDLTTETLTMVHRRQIGQVLVSLTVELTQDGWVAANDGRPTLHVPDLDALNTELSDDLQAVAVLLEGTRTVLA